MVSGAGGVQRVWSRPRFLDAARAVDLAAATGYGGVDVAGNGGYPSWQAFLLDVDRDPVEARTHSWPERLGRSPYGLAAFEAAYAWLAILAPRCPDERHVVHSDLFNRNVFVEGDHLSGVIDWGCMLYGDFLYDVAWLTFWAPWYPAWRGIDFAAEALAHWRGVGLDVPDAATRLRCYELHIGLAHYAYNAFQGRWQTYEQTVARTQAIVDALAAREPSTVSTT